jgi:hypothetical protein
MNHKVRVIKRADRREPKHDREQQPSPHPTREITTTIKLWVSEFKQSRRRDEQHPSLTSARVEERLIKSFRT